MFDLDMFIVAVYYYVSLLYRCRYPRGIRQRGFTPQLTDEEALTIAIVGEFLGLGTDEAIYTYFRRHYQAWFPALRDRTLLVRQWVNLWTVKYELWQAILQKAGVLFDPHQVIDTIPIPICEQVRASRRRILRGDPLLEPDYGYCDAKDWHYFGFKGALRISWDGFIVQAGLVSPRPHDSQHLDTLLAEVTPGTIICSDKAFVDRAIQTALYQKAGILLKTPKKKNMAPSPFDMDHLGNRVRRLIETVGSQLKERFHIQQLKIRKGWTLIAKWYRKILAHTMCVWLNKLHGRDPLDFDGLVTI